jgi:hypothetical protein
MESLIYLSSGRPDLLNYIRTCLIVYLLESDESDQGKPIGGTLIGTHAG